MISTINDSKLMTGFRTRAVSQDNQTRTTVTNST